MSETTFCDLSAGIQHVPFFRNVLDSSECFDGDQETPNKARLVAKRERAKQRLVERENAMLSNIGRLLDALWIAKLIHTRQDPEATCFSRRDCCSHSD